MARGGFGTAIGTNCGSVFGAILLAVFFAVFFAGLFVTPVRAQDAAIGDLQLKISAARTAQQTFARGLLHCSELNGTNFYFQSRDRVLELEDYHRSLENLALQGSFNPTTKRPWTKQDADARWAEAQREAVRDKANCEVVASLPDLQKKLQALQQQTASSQSDPNKK